MPLFLYTLELKGSHFYVGTTNNPAARLKEHKGGAGAEWTRLHPPLHFSKKYKTQKLECSDEAGRLQEDAHVKVVMLAHGLGSVRGGSYSRPDLSREDVKALSKELYHATNGCLRCGHQNHWADECFARTDVMGNAIEDDDQRAAAAAAESGWQGDRGGHLSPSASSTRRPSRNSPGGCLRCGRSSHMIKRCFAKCDADGRVLEEEGSYSRPHLSREGDRSGRLSSVSSNHSGSGRLSCVFDREGYREWTRKRSPGWCLRCGRSNHTIEDCVAKVDVDGCILDECYRRRGRRR
jgi:predicted GIY-YIG superfamily endonuclease